MVDYKSSKVKEALKFNYCYHLIFVQVEIEATVAGWRGDIAIDELHFTPGLCPIKAIVAAAAGTIPTLRAPTTGLLVMAPPYSKQLFFYPNLLRKSFTVTSSYQRQNLLNLFTALII